METILLKVEPEQAGQRADTVLTALLPQLSRSAVQRLMEAGAVTVQGKPVRKQEKLVTGTLIEVQLPQPEAVEAQPQALALDVVYEDEDLIVVNKPAGMVVHPAPGHPDGTLVNALLFHCGQSLSGVGGVLRPGIVHRIDRDTSGLIVAAKNDFAHQALSAQLADHSLTRRYECIVLGKLRQEAGTVDAPIGRHPYERKKMAVVPGGRCAVTHWAVIARYSGYTHVSCRLETGRTHQIRVHLASLGHPIWGDTVYGGKKPVSGLRGQCLHAVELRLCHPRSRQTLALSCPLPQEFVRALEKLGQAQD